MGFTVPKSTKIVDQVFDILKETLEGREKLRFLALGNFLFAKSGREKDGTPKQVRRW